MKIAYFCEPQIGGTFSFFTKIRPRLAAYGIDFRCIPPMSAERFPGTRFAGLEGVDYVTFADNDPVEATRVLLRHLEQQDFRAVIILPGTDVVCTNIVRYIPRTIRTIARVPMFTRGAYAPAKGLEHSLDMLVGVCDRIVDDLREKYAVNSDKLTVIYNGIDVTPVYGDRIVRSSSSVFRIVFTGRIVDSHKGVFLLPKMFKHVLAAGIDAHMTLVGSGPDETRLLDMIKRDGLTSRITHVGALSPERLNQELEKSDCYVLPSYYEGCPNALLEAMVAGLPPVVSRLVGSTDRIIDDGRTGWLAEVGSVDSFAEKIIWLAQNPREAAQMGSDAREKMISCFSIDKTARAYADVLHGVQMLPDRREPQSDLAEFTVSKALNPTWRTLIPGPVKRNLRKWLERIGVSS